MSQHPLRAGPAAKELDRGRGLGLPALLHYGQITQRAVPLAGDDASRFAHIEGNEPPLLAVAGAGGAPAH